MNDLIEFTEGTIADPEDVNKNFRLLKTLISEYKNELTTENLMELLTENENELKEGLASSADILQVKDLIAQIYSYSNNTTTNSQIKNATEDELSLIPTGSTSAIIREDVVTTYNNNGTVITTTKVTVSSLTNKTTTVTTTETRIENGMLADLRKNSEYVTIETKIGQTTLLENNDTDKYYQITGNTVTYTSTKANMPTITAVQYYTAIDKAHTIVPITNNENYWIKKTYKDAGKTKLLSIEFGGTANCTISRASTYCFDFEPPTDSDISDNLNKIYNFDFIVKEGEVPSSFKMLVGYSDPTPSKFLNKNFIPSGVLNRSYSTGFKGGAIRVSKDSGTYCCVINWSKKIICL